MDIVTTQLPEDWTGERWVPGVWGAIAAEHMHRYALAASLTRDADVLDVACGEGYGSAWLAQVARTVVGVDISVRVVAQAHQRYRNSNLQFLCAHAGALPFPDDSFDWVTCFETIEHLTEQPRLIAEVRRVLRPNGHLVLSSPDRQAYAALSTQDNPFHVSELSAPELRALLAVEFPCQQWFGQSTGFFSSFAPIEEPQPAKWSNVTLDCSAPERIQGLPRPTPLYWLVLAGASPCRPQEAAILLTSRTVHSPPAQATQMSGRTRWYRWGDRVDFQRGGNGPIYQRHGWDEPTLGGTWTLGTTARLQFDVFEPPGTHRELSIRLIVQALVGPDRPAAHVALRLNGHLFFEGPVSLQMEIAANLSDLQLVSAVQFVLDIEIFDPVSPLQLGQSLDARPLGLLWKEAILAHRTQAAPDTLSTDGTNA
jgi:SAM-dependent methyltransferase